jgi:sugar/nucleoside kinase (ribokinase family)
VAVTRADCSAVVLRDSPGTNLVHEQAAPEVDVVDTAGRQAAFAGCLLGLLAKGTPLHEALPDAVAAAALACTVPGPFLTATRGEIEDVATGLTDE